MTDERGGGVNLLISFSGGRTSAYMTKQILESDHGYDDVAVVFANTGMEHPKTLEFVDRCDREFGFGTVWVEAVTRQGRQSSTFQVVDFETASRDGEPFESMILKYGIPNKAYPHCTRELKQNAIHSYIKSLGWDEYDTAIGIREDEIRRVSKSGPWSIVYPLIDWWPVDKQDINTWWERQSFNLEIPEHLGNCVMCWKKSFRKLAHAIEDEPWAFDWADRIERRHGLAGHNVDGNPRVFFRQNMSAQQLVDLTEPIRKQQTMLFDDIDADGGCSESCEPFIDR